MNRPRTLLLTSIVAASLAAVGWWHLSHRADSMPNARPILSKANEVAHPSDEKAALKKDIAQTQPTNILHSDRYAELVGAATAGDTDAAYLLAQGREACQKLRAQRVIHEGTGYADKSKGIASTEEKEFEQKRMKQEAEIRRLGELCIGKEEVSYDELHDAWARAALLGSRDAQYEYALNPHLNPLYPANDLRRLREWRDAAPRYLNDLLQSGDSRAALALAAASDQDDCQLEATKPEMDVCIQSGIISMILPQEEATAYKYYFLDQLLGDTAQKLWVANELRKLETMLTPEQIATAQAEAQQMYAKIRGGG